MAPMESIEGGSREGKTLPPISATDKIIVAFAGPLFSILLALAAAGVVYVVGKPRDFVPETRIGHVEPGSPAAQAGFQIGDRILAINGDPVEGFAGSLDSIMERIVLSRGEQIVFTVERLGESEPLTLTAGHETAESRWFQRRALRKVGIGPARQLLVESVIKNSPSEKAGIVPGDRLTAVDGKNLFSISQLVGYLRSNEWKTVFVEVESRDGMSRIVELTPERPIQPEGADPDLGVTWDYTREVDVRIVHPGPVEQVGDTLRMMWATVTSVASPKSGIGVDHLSGPVGIGKMIYQLLQTEDGWRRVLSFMVLLNVNLAVLNMLPFPVLDGGHITLAVLEKIFRRPIKARPLEVIQTACALALISLMLYVTSKDIGDGIGRGGPPPDREVIFSAE
jgi:regulator of sigma E protease